LVVKVITPTRLLAEAADVLADIRDDLVVVGAAALEVALASDRRVEVTATRDLDVVVITPTRDIDAVVPVDRAAVVVSRLEGAGLRRSEVDNERAFTWVRGDLKGAAGSSVPSVSEAASAGPAGKPGVRDGDEPRASDHDRVRRRP
jgi:hypothetical protein